MIILGIETSCDETAAAIVQHTPTPANPYQAEILAQTVYSQFSEHEIYGGVVPEIAARAHAERLPAIVQKTLQQANLTLEDLGAITSTTGPGLVGALLMGTTFAKTLALASHKAFYPTNHIEGHVLTPLLTEENLRPPYLCLLVSGGHCQLIEVTSIGHYTTLGSTLDDAIGECFDKVGKMFAAHDPRFTHPYAPKVEIAAKEAAQNSVTLQNATKQHPHAPKRDAYAINLPHPKTERDLDFSFSGLKTAVRQTLDKAATRNTITPPFINHLAAVFQQTAANSLAEKTAKALTHLQNKHGKPLPLVVSGGVAVNQTIRATLKTVAQQQNTTLYAPPIGLCADNAVMIAYAAALRMQHNPKPNLQAKPRPRWPLEEMVL